MSDAPPPARGARFGGLRALLLAALTLPILFPLFRPGWLQSHEGLSYPIRLVELARCWEDGFLSARWFPDLNYGQGYPFLSFYAPLLFFVAGAFHVLGADVATALKLAAAVGVVAGAFGTDRLVREALRGGADDAGGGGEPSPASSSAGFVGAALFVFAPYTVRDLFIRGDLAELFAIGFLPWSLWGLLRLRRTRRPRDVVGSAALGAIPILAHNIVGFLTGSALVVTGAIVVFAARRRRSAIAAVAASGAGTLLLSAFFWVPALLEKRFVQIDVLTSGDFRVFDHFVSPWRLLGRGEFPGVGQGLPMTVEIGWVGLAAAAFGLAHVRTLWRTRRAFLLVGLLLFFGGAAPTMEASRPIYETAALLRYIQFPWRFLSFVALGAALLGALGYDAAAERIGPRARAAHAAAVVLGAIGFVAPLLGPKPNFPLPKWAVDPAELRETRETTTRGEYMPRDAVRLERPRGFIGGVRIDGAARAAHVRRTAGRYTIALEADEPVVVALQDFWVPGWTARLDGAPVRLDVEPGTGRMLLAAPAGSTTIEVRLEATPLRRAASIASAAAALLAAALLAAGYSPRRGARSQR